MASLSSNTNSLTLSFLLLLSFTITLSTANPSIKIAGGALNQLCSKTTNPSYCMKVLKSDPRTASADLKGLAKISIDIAQKKGIDTLNLIKSLAQKEPSPALKGKYSSCSKKYSSAVSNLEQAKQAAGSGDYARLGSLVLSASDAVLGCKDEFEAPPSAPPSLSQDNENTADLINIVFNVAGEL